MKSISKTNYLFAAFALLILVVSGATFAKRQEKAAGQPAKPGAAEMERLRFYVGEWDYTEAYEKTSFAPNGGQNTGVYTSKLGPGGNSLVNTFHSQGPVGNFEGLLVLTWDLKEKAYKQYVFGNDFPGAVEETGQFEGDALVFRGELATGAIKISIRNSTRVIGPGKIVSDEFVSMNGAPEKLLVRVEARKR
jgi:hypothetical protein